MPLRRPKTFEEVHNVLREVFNQLDYLRTKNIDLKQKRIINAHPSINDYDYVVRKELHDLVGGGRTPVQRTRKGGTGTTLTYDKITFGLGIGRSVAVGDNVTPPYIWTNSANGRPEIIAVAANFPPTGSNMLLDIRCNGVSILTGGQFIFPAGTAARVVVHGTSFVRVIFKRYDVITAHVSQVGSTVAGQEVEVVVFCNLI